MVLPPLKAYWRVRARLACSSDFWDPEDGYYLNSTYYGGKNLLSRRSWPAQLQNGRHGVRRSTFLLEEQGRVAVGRSSPWKANARTTTIWAAAPRVTGRGSKAAYGTIAFIPPKRWAPGKIQVLGEGWATADYRKRAAF